MDLEIANMLKSSSATVISAADILPFRESLDLEINAIHAASARGYFLPNEEELIKLRYSQYLTLRVSLLATIEEVGSLAGQDNLAWKSKLPLFATAFAAACVLLRANRFIVSLASEKSILWKKLDEADVVNGIPRKSFTTVFKALSDLHNQRRFLKAADFFVDNRESIYALSDHLSVRPIIALLKTEEPSIERRRSEVMKQRLAYRWFSFLRRNRSAWKHVMGGLFEFSGRAVADLRQPGIKHPDAPKRISHTLQDEALDLAKPGDVFVTRHDDALSNWFLPGFWPHAALYLGETDDNGACFLESKKDGVHVRSARETLAVDALLVLRPPLEKKERQQGLEQALQHRNKPYDFLFDFRTADRLVCTEVVYRGFHGIGPVNFELREVGGRLCLPAEELITQALSCGYELILTAGLDGNKVLIRTEAHHAFTASRIYKSQT